MFTKEKLEELSEMLMLGMDWRDADNRWRKFRHKEDEEEPEPPDGGNKEELRSQWEMFAPIFEGKTPPPDENEEVFDWPQLGDEWFAAQVGQGMRRMCYELELGKDFLARFLRDEE